MSPILLTLAVIPGLVICFLIYKIDKFEKEPIIHLTICFFLGIASCFPAIKLESIGDKLGYDEFQGLGNLLIFSYIIIALSEELVKYLVLVFYAYPKKIFSEPLDGILYSVMIGMGFATLENLLYADRFGLQTVMVRAFTAVPAHAVFAIIMGYFVGLAKYNVKNRAYLLTMGLIVPFIIHGTYDFFILQQYYEWLMVLATFTLCVSAFFAIRVIRLHQQNSPFKELFISETIVETTQINSEDIEIIDQNSPENLNIKDE
jgi:RsiW-degrading membrane proteinase PrsW (M82 family)